MKRIFTSILAIVILLLSIASSITATAVDKQINYKSTISYSLESSCLAEYVYKFRKIHDNRDIYFVIDNYDLYKELGYNQKSKNFFKTNLLIINCVYGGIGKRESRENTGITIKDGIVNISYTRSFKNPIPCMSVNKYDFIELKKSDVKDVDLTKLIVNMKIRSLSIEGVWNEGSSIINMKYINAGKLIKKPEQVKKVKAQSPKKKQLKVTWKKIKGTKYQVQYSLKKNMKKAKLKNTKKNKIALKKLKSNKKYYVRVRAYKTVNGKIYLGKWSKKLAKTVK